jgi:hypothetical protein
VPSHPRRNGACAQARERLNDALGSFVVIPAKAHGAKIGSRCEVWSRKRAGSVMAGLVPAIHVGGRIASLRK